MTLSGLSVNFLRHYSYQSCNSYFCSVIFCSVIFVKPYCCHTYTKVAEMNNSEFSSSSSSFVKIVEGVKDGKPIKFFIRQIPKDRYEEAADHMCTYFLADESMCKSENVINDSEAVQEFRSLFREALDDNLSVGAFVENPEGGKSIMAALNVLYLGGKKEKIDFNTTKSEKVGKVLQVMGETLAGVDTQKLYGCDTYLGGFGLSVNPSYRGNAIGYHLLMARNEIGMENGISATITVFTSPVSAKLATRSGFVVLREIFRDELFDDNGQLLVPKCETVSFKCMGKRLN